jgi:membrane protease YdiL (CAAX protease family)
MKKLLIAKPLWASAIVFIALFAIVILLSIVVHTEWANHLKAGVVLLGIWFLYRLEGKNLSELGLTGRSFYLLPIGLLIGIVYFSVLFGLQMVRNDIKIEFNNQFNGLLIFNGLLFLLGSVLIEEFIFRGYCFKKTYQELGIAKANWIFAFLFIVYHWMALNAWGNWGMMLGLITTGFGHLLFATAFVQSRTLFLPIGIHLGNNWAQRHFFSIKSMGVGDSSSLEDSLFSITVANQNDSTFHTIGSYLVTFTCSLFATYLIWKWYNRNTPLSPD